jgi:hypothetical protein
MSFIKDLWNGAGLLWRQPIGLLVRLFALIIILDAPQVPDLFDGLIGVAQTGKVDSGSWHAIGYAVAALLLALASWYWTRAGLVESVTLAERLRLRVACRWRASHLSEDNQKLLQQFTDHARTRPRPARPSLADDDMRSEILGEALPLVMSLILVLAPMFVASQSSAAIWGLPAVILVLGFVVFRYWFVWHPPTTPPWLWWTRTTALFAAAPFGWRFALMFFFASLACVVLLAREQWLIERNLHSPTVALVALAALIGLLSVLFPTKPPGYSGMIARGVPR